ncbi:hypothetical protein PNEG_01429 [Pneumocystis murina B123]|uniref:LAG1-DNAbind-domain-containing protein n=1 Tax=Pneumocystis murina (strain B123) TaxID=1069680 RepID=M7P8F4_PNEMU|nr:hypothetical protein PNEG_01429 [Pneumocystis murina B123]EMR10155.1 hypothetical protein PNEG_01429 [Pneumocystis murina B123]
MYTSNYQNTKNYVHGFCDTYGNISESSPILIDYDKDYIPRDISSISRIALPSPPRDNPSNYKMQTCRQDSMQTSVNVFIGSTTDSSSTSSNNKNIKHTSLCSDTSNICCSHIKPSSIDPYSMLYGNQDMFSYSKSIASQSETNSSLPISDTFDYLHCLPTPTTLGSTSWAYPEYTYDKSPICSEFSMQHMMFSEYPGLISDYNNSNIMDCSTFSDKDYGYMTYKMSAPNLFTSDLMQVYDNDPTTSSNVHNMTTQSCGNAPSSFHMQSEMFGSMQYNSSLNSPLELPPLTNIQYDHSLHSQYKKHNTNLCFNRVVDKGDYSSDRQPHDLSDQRNKCFKVDANNIMLHSIKKTNDSLAVRRGKPISSLIKSFIPLSESILQSIVNDYISLTPSGYQKHRYSIIIYTSKVAQKSYGTEKRYLCPPPCLRLLGSKWFEGCLADIPLNSFPGTNQKENTYGTNVFGMYSFMDIYATSLLLDVEESFNISSMDCYCSDGTIFKPGSSKTTPVWGKINLRSMYVPDRKEKIRSACLKVQLHKKNKEFNFVQFQSSPICIISKASQKKTSSKNNDMLIYHGSMIALFNRSKAQTNRIRFLGTSSNSSITNSVPSGLGDHQLELSPENIFLTATSQVWEPFLIWSLDLFVNPGSCENIDQSMTLIRFNQAVVLQCSTTGLITIPLIIRRVDGRNTVIKGQENSKNDHKNMFDLDEPVNSLQKVAFQVYNENSNLPDIYLTYQDENIIMQSARYIDKEEIDTKLSDYDKLSNKKSLWDISSSNSAPDTFLPSKDLLDNIYNKLFSYHDFMQKYGCHHTSGMNNNTIQNSPYKTRSSIQGSIFPQNLSIDKSGSSSLENNFENAEIVMENAIWNIVGISSVESSFYISPKSNATTIGLVPVIKEVKYLSVNIIQIIGQNINQSYSVWIDGKPCKTFRFSTFFAEDSSMFIDLQCILHPQIMPQDPNHILLVRDDGVVFDSKRHI